MKKEFKKIVGTLAMAGFLAFSGSFTTAYANEIKVRFEGQYVDINPAPIIVDSRTFVPARAISEMLGAEVGWNPETREVSINLGDINILLTIDSNSAIVNGQNIELDAPAQILNGSTIIPLRFVAENLGVYVDFVHNTVMMAATAQGLSAQLPQVQPPQEQPPQEQPQPPQEQQQVTAQSHTLFSGTFTVGQDIPAGRYVVTSGDGSGNFIVHNVDDRLHVNEILSEPGSTRRGLPSVTADFGYGYQIRISGINEVIFTPAQRSSTTTLTTGHWVVGTDVPAGTFDAVPYSNGSGNFIVHHANGRLAYNEILGGNRTQRVRVNLQTGQTIRISGLEYVEFVAP